MKFYNGYWMTQKGMKQNWPYHAYEITPSDDSLKIIAPCAKVTTRADTLEGPLITVELSSPMSDIIRVRIYHFKGLCDKGPHFEINEDHSFKPEISVESGIYEFKSGGLSVKVPEKDSWHMDFFYDGEKITSSSNRGMAYVTADNGESYVKEMLDLDVGECIYGLGEHFTAFVKNGQTIDMWNADGGTCSEQAYKNIPFYVSSSGYGVFVNHTEKVSFEIASEVVSKVQFSVPGEMIEYFVIGGPTIKEVLGRYTALTGRPSLPPAWSFGLWLSTSFVTDYDEQTVTGFVDEMARRKLPLSVFHFDSFWMKEFSLCDFEWDKRIFPDPKGMLARLKAKGLHICVWMNPYISQQSKLFDEAMDKGYLIKKTNGDVWQWDLWQPGMGIVDFTNPDACRWFASKLEYLCDIGVDCFKTDFGERIPTDDVVYFDGSDPKKMHNYYTYLYNKVVFNVIRKKRSDGNAIVFARSATAGSQQFPVHWGGDCTANYPSMAESLRGGLSLGMSGFGFWSHDMGGFESTATADVYKRWLAFGLLSSHSRLHGNNSYRVPWVYDEEACDVLRFFTNLKCSMMPYIYKSACEARDLGLPIMRAMPIEFQFDPACMMLDRQYMFGDSLLVAPIFSESGRVRYYLPDGKWLKLLTGELLDGGHWQDEKHGYMSLPLLVRPNRIIAFGCRNDMPDYDYTDNLTFYISHFDDGARYRTYVYDNAGIKKISVEAWRSGGKIMFAVSGADKPWKAKFAAISPAKVSSIAGGTLSADGNAAIVVPDSVESQIVIEI